MTRIYMDATTLIALGTIGELALLESFDGTPVVLPSIRDEVTTSPPRRTSSGCANEIRSERRFRTSNWMTREQRTFSASPI